jgi:hypothetical protein
MAMGFREEKWTAKSAAHRLLCHPPGGRFTRPGPQTRSWSHRGHGDSGLFRHRKKRSRRLAARRRAPSRLLRASGELSPVIQGHAHVWSCMVSAAGAVQG